MRKSIVYPLLEFGGVLVSTGCERVGEPWDSTGYFQDERGRTVAVQKNLRDRGMHSQGDSEIAMHQTDYQR